MMKKLLVIIVCFFTLASVFTFGDEKPIEGYRNLPWGSTLKDVISIYPNMQRGQFYDTYQASEGNIVREFAFFQNKLYEVVVTYYNISDTKRENTIKTIKELYRLQDPFETTDIANVPVERYKYSPDLTISLFHIPKWQKVFSVIYRSTIISQEREKQLDKAEL